MVSYIVVMHLLHKFLFFIYEAIINVLRKLEEHLEKRTLNFVDSFYMRRSRKVKKYSQVVSFFALLGSEIVFQLEPFLME